MSAEDLHQADCAAHDDKPCNCKCQRCKCCSLEWVDCWSCGGAGGTEPGDLYDEDPLWYSPDDTEDCQICEGAGGWNDCIGRCNDNGVHEHAEAS